MILIVEDHAQLRRILCQSLAERDYEVISAASGEEALGLFEAGLQCRLVFSDIRMPGRINGLQLAQWLREHRPSVAVLLQTGYTHDGTDSFPVLRKPYSDEELYATFATLIGGPEHNPVAPNEPVRAPVRGPGQS